MKINFVVPGEPKAQARPRGRVVMKNKKPLVIFYDEEECVNYKKLVKMYAGACLHQSGWEYQESAPLLFNAVCYMPIRPSWTKKKQEDARAGLIYPTGKPDVDNLQKALQDALNGFLFKDDSQFVVASTRKKYADEPRVEIEIEVIE